MKRFLTVLLVLGLVTATEANMFIAGQSITSGSTSITGGASGELCFNSSGFIACGDPDLTFSGTILTATGFSGPLNGTVGAGTPAAGTFTTLTANTAIAAGSDNAVAIGSTSVRISTITAGTTIGVHNLTSYLGSITSTGVLNSRATTFSGSGANSCDFIGTGFVCEGTSVDNQELIVTLANPTTGDQTWTFPDAAATVSRTFASLEAAQTFTGTQIAGTWQGAFNASDASAGLTNTAFTVCQDATCTNTCTMAFKNGILTTATSCS